MRWWWPLGDGMLGIRGNGSAICCPSTLIPWKSADDFLVSSVILTFRKYRHTPLVPGRDTSGRSARSLTGHFETYFLEDHSNTARLYQLALKMPSRLQSISPQPSCDDQASHSPQLGKSRFYKSTSSPRTKCSCSRGCVCHTNKNNESPHDASSPSRGRSTTPKYDRTNGNGRFSPAGQVAPFEAPSWLTATSSVDGQEGLAYHQIERNKPIEIGDLGTHAHDSIQHWLEQHHTSTHPYAFTTSPEASMMVETSTMAPSVASSGFLPPRVPSSADLLSFAGEFDGGGELKVQPCAFTPLWLTHERRYCRGMQFEGSEVEATAGYPDTIDLFGAE